MTSNCHLCDEAEAILQKTISTNITTVEIANSDTLLTTYGLRIPVLRRSDTNEELNWPFNGDDIRLFIA